MDRPSNKNKEIIYIYGPKMRTNAEMVDVVKKVSGKDIKVVYQDEETYVKGLEAKGFPAPIISYFIKVTKEPDSERYPLYDTAKSNIKDYSGHEPTSFEEFVKGYLA